jgi:dimethylamine monooxygenase subunit A
MIRGMPFDPASISAPFRMQPGLRRLAAGSPQLHANAPGSAHLAAKLAVLRDHADAALCAVPGWDAAPALQALCAQACTDQPQAWGPGPRGGWQARLLGWSVNADQVHGDGPAEIGEVLRGLPPPWRLAGLLALALKEDLAVLDGLTATVPWLAVCMPSHWAPRDKLGRHFAEVHAPVADNQLLLQAADALSRLVSGPATWERFVWTLTTSAALDGHPARQPSPPWPAAADADELAASAWLRTERQTFIPVPAHSQAVFTIEVEQRPLTDFVAREPAATPALAAALASMSDAVLAYRGLGPARARLIDWLQAQPQPDAGA